MAEVQSLALNINSSKNKNVTKKKFIRYNRFGSEINLIDDMISILNIELEKYSLQTDLRKNLIDIAKNIDNFNHMNMRYLAAALVWINMNNYSFDFETLEDQTTLGILKTASNNEDPSRKDYIQLFTYLNKIKKCIK